MSGDWVNIEGPIDLKVGDLIAIEGDDKRKFGIYLLVRRDMSYFYTDREFFSGIKSFTNPCMLIRDKILYKLS